LHTGFFWDWELERHLFRLQKRGQTVVVVWWLWFFCWLLSVRALAGLAGDDLEGSHEVIGRKNRPIYGNPSGVAGRKLSILKRQMSDYRGFLLT
jgi:hypothetical protein